MKIMKITVEGIKKAIENTDYSFYGIRADEIQYDTGDIANVSHQLYQDPDYDEDGELVYLYIEEGPYEGYYDAGELNGTCAIKFDPEDDSSICAALETVSMYFPKYIHVLGGDSANSGNDRDEIIISDATVLAVGRR